MKRHIVKDISILRSYCEARLRVKLSLLNYTYTVKLSYNEVE